MKANKKKGWFKGGNIPSLTPVEQEMLLLLTKEFLTPKQVALKRKCSTQYIYRIIRKLKDKGAINTGYQGVAKIRSTLQPNQPIRLHGQEFNIKIIFNDEFYRDQFKKCNTIFIDGNTVRLYKKSIEIYSGQSFFADTVQKATVKSMEYWRRFFSRLENDLRLILVKPRSQNIRLVNQHYAEINNELAEECEKKADKIKVYTRDDGKLWFTIDKSFTNEAETLHPETAKQDMQEAVRPFFNDLRDNKPPKLSELSAIIYKLAAVNEETAQGLNAIVKYMEMQIPKFNNHTKTKKEPRPNYFG